MLHVCFFLFGQMLIKYSSTMFISPFQGQMLPSTDGNIGDCLLVYYWVYHISSFLQFLLEDYELILVSNVGQKILELNEGFKRNIISTCRGFSITTFDDTGGVASTQLSVHDFHGLIFMIINRGFYRWGYPQMDGLVEKPIKMDDQWL